MKAKSVLILIILGVCSATASGLPISYISATTIPTTFSPPEGDPESGTLCLQGILPLIVHYSDHSQQVFDQGSFYLSTSLWQDTSAAGVLTGVFKGGTLTLRDSEDTVLLAGTVVALNLNEVFNDIGMLSAAGTFRAEGGLFMDDGSFGYPQGAIYEILFEVDPRALSDLATAFEGLSNISLAPIIPEPGIACLLCLGLGGLILRRRKRV